MNKIDWPLILNRLQGLTTLIMGRLLILMSALAVSTKALFRRKWVRFSLWILAGLLVIFTGLQVTGRMMAARSWQAWPAELKASLSQVKSTGPIKEPGKYVAGLEKALLKLGPRGMYILIDTAQNRIQVRKGDETLHDAVVSCGSGNVLDDLDGKRSWVFDTPRGEFSVKYKLRDPVWIKPDWAFVEEGTPIPKSRNDRVETGVLGEYALGFGDGFFIHGTLYTRLLGRSVTHGCVRVGDKDLELIYKKVPLGTPIFIY